MVVFIERKSVSIPNICWSFGYIWKATWPMCKRGYESLCLGRIIGIQDNILFISIAFSPDITCFAFCRILTTNNQMIVLVRWRDNAEVALPTNYAQMDWMTCTIMLLLTIALESKARSFIALVSMHGNCIAWLIKNKSEAFKSN